MPVYKGLNSREGIIQQVLANGESESIYYFLPAELLILMRGLLGYKYILSKSNLVIYYMLVQTIILSAALLYSKY